MKTPSHKTKIVCTIGPASESPEALRQLVEAGMDVARLNFSHGKFEAHRRVVDGLRAAAAAAGRHVAIMADLPGPKMRVGTIADEPVELKAGAPFVLTTEEVVGDQGRVSVTFARLPQVVKPGDTLSLNDGQIQLEVVAAHGTEVDCTVRVGGELRSRKGLNLPGIDLGISAFTERDRECLAFALSCGVDAVSQSFVDSAADLVAVRQAAADLGHQPFVIAKIERAGALERIEAILDAADGIMIARGDLGVEVPIERIALVQKHLMRLANQRAKPVITATQMLESMTASRIPTRAEATDVANAILDGTDCVMLSAESAVGKFPVDATRMLAKIAAATEVQRPVSSVRELFRGVDLAGRIHPAHLVALGVEASLEHVVPAAVLVPTRSGATARGIARFRFPVWTVAVSSEVSTCRQLQFSAGVFPVHETDFPGRWNGYARRLVGDLDLAGDLVILTEGPSPEHPAANHRMEIIDLTRPEP